MEPDANLLAWAVLLGFPVVTFSVMAWARHRAPVAMTATGLMLAGVMFLPARLGLDLPALPPFDKSNIVSGGVLFACWAFHRERVRWRELFGSAGFVFVMLAGGFATALTNEDPLVYGPTYVSALTTYDGFQLGVETLVTYALPYSVGRVAIRTPSDIGVALRTVAIAALLYTPLVLYEIRMSPQLHTDLYGYPAFDDWFQALRGGGFRPNVFMNHGLSLAFWLMIAVVATAALWRAEERGMRPGPKWTLGILGVVLLACNSLGAAVYACVIVPIVRLATPRRMAVCACFFAAFAMAYPIMKARDLVPSDRLVELAASHSEERAQSLEFRFVNEQALLDRATDRPLFGWGGFGRNLVFDGMTGEMLTIPDGSWIIVLGQRGVVGWFCVFALLLLPIVRAWRALGRASHEEAVYLGALALIVGIHGLDAIPNSFSDMLPFFYAGALGGVARHVALRRRRRRPAPPPERASEPPAKAPAPAAPTTVVVEL